VNAFLTADVVLHGCKLAYLKLIVVNSGSLTQLNVTPSSAGGPIALPQDDDLMILLFYDNQGTPEPDCTVQLLSPASLIPFKYIFVTVNVYFGQINDFKTAAGGIAAADRICNQSASGSYPGSYQALLCTTTASAVDRYPKSNSVQFRLPGGVLVANTWQDLFTGQLQSPVNTFNNGQTTSNNVWSGCQSGGVSFPGSALYTCDDWTNSDANGGNLSPQKPTLGSTSATDDQSFWDVTPTECYYDYSYRCIQV